MKRARFLRRRPVELTLLLFVLSGLACNERHDLGSGGGYVGGTGKRDASTIKQPEKKPPQTQEEEPEETEKAPDPEPKKPSEAPPKYTELTQVWKLGELHDLGPAGPATATDRGVYFVTRSDQVALIKRKGKKFEELNVPREYFAKYGRGPSVSKTHAYWISERGFLLRIPVKGGKVEVLFDKARLGTRTSVVTAAGRDVVTFIAEINKKPLAHVWASRGKNQGEVLRLTPEGATASSVSLVEGVPHPRAIVLAGRLGMSPVHVRRIRTTKKRLTLEPDEVVWIGPGSHMLTEIHAIAQPFDTATAFLPTAKDFNDFGLAQLKIKSEPGELDEPDWHIYLNGLDPAPIATAKICGKPHVLFARPTEQRPRSPQELHLAPITNQAPGDGEVIGRSRAFNDISLAPTKSGAVATWTADHRTWGLVLDCPKQ